MHVSSCGLIIDQCCWTFGNMDRQIAFRLAKMAGGIVHGCVCTMTTFHNMMTIIQLVGHAMLANSSIHLKYIGHPSYGQFTTVK